MATLREAFMEQLHDIYDGENQIVEALPTMAEAATGQKLKDTLTEHVGQTRGQIKRLERIFSELGQSPSRKSCKGVQGLLDEGREILEKPAGPTRDALLITGAQRVEHYEMAVYGTLRSWAEELELDDAAELLSDTLDEESAADEKLTSIAEGGLLTEGVNEEAASARK